MSREVFVQLMQEMADLTKPACASCRVPHACCDGMYCGIAIEYAKNVWGVALEPTGHPDLPLMGETGCTAPPHLRPICTLHACSIAGIGASSDPKWDDRYYQLRDKIMETYVALEEMGDMV